jgi:hypothetical protein
VGRSSSMSFGDDVEPRVPRGAFRQQSKRLTAKIASLETYCNDHVSPAIIEELPPLKTLSFLKCRKI